MGKMSNNYWKMFLIYRQNYFLCAYTLNVEVKTVVKN